MSFGDELLFVGTVFATYEFESIANNLSILVNRQAAMPFQDIQSLSQLVRRPVITSRMKMVMEIVLGEGSPEAALPTFLICVSSGSSVDFLGRFLFLCTVLVDASTHTYIHTDIHPVHKSQNGGTLRLRNQDLGFWDY